jgi:dihydroneopterin aldolase
MSNDRHAAAARDFISIEGLDVECIIGLYEHERITQQHVIVGITMAVDANESAEQERLEATVDYEWVSSQIAFILKVGRFRLLETAALTICRALLLKPVLGEGRANIESVDLTLRKPGALLGRGVPSLRMLRQGSDLSFARENRAFGTVDVIQETRDAGFYRLNVLPGHGIDRHVHQQMSETELVLTEGLYCQGEAAARGTVRSWPLGLAHQYHNPSELVQSLLCIDRPPFIERDEIACGGEVMAVSPQQVWDL